MIIPIILLTSLLAACKKANTTDNSENQLNASFNLVNSENKEGTAVEFKNTSSDNALKYLWDFGNGKQSSEKNAINNYPIHGNYIVTLTVTDASGFSNKISKEIIVNCIFRSPGSPSNPGHAPLF